MKKIVLSAIMAISILEISAQRMLVLPDTPTFANQYKGTIVLRNNNLTPYWSNGLRWNVFGSSSTTSIKDTFLTSANWNLANRRLTFTPNYGSAFATALTGLTSYIDLGDTAANLRSQIATKQNILGNASATTSGILTSTDWNTFNSKQNALTAGANISIVGNVISASGGGGITTTQLTDSLNNRAQNYWARGGNSVSSTTNKLGTLNKLPLEFLTNGITRLKIDTLPSVGGVGINKDPQFPLDVAGRTRTDTLQIVAGAGVGKQLVSDANGLASWKLPTFNGFGISQTSGSANDEFLVIAAGYLKPSNSFAHGTTMTWSLSPATSDHSGFFATSVEGNNTTGDLTVRYPRVKTVVTSILQNDEATARELLYIGGSIGVSNSDFVIKQPVNLSVRLIGAGTSWTKSGTYNAQVTVGSFNTTTGVVGIGGNGKGWDYETTVFTYQGTNNYRVQNVFSGLGAFNIGFKLIDNATGNPVTSLTSSDEVIVSNLGKYWKTINANMWLNGVNEPLTGAGGANFWYYGLFEAYMVVQAYQGVNVVKWQDYAGATSYKLYRDTNANFTSQTLLYSGTNKDYADNSVTSSTKYYYKLVGVVSGVDTDITTFTKIAK